MLCAPLTALDPEATVHDLFDFGPTRLPCYIDMGGFPAWLLQHTGSLSPAAVFELFVAQSPPFAALGLPADVALAYARSLLARGSLLLLLDCPSLAILTDATPFLDAFITAHLAKRHQNAPIRGAVLEEDQPFVHVGNQLVIATRHIGYFLRRIRGPPPPVLLTMAPLTSAAVRKLATRHWSKLSDAPLTLSSSVGITSDSAPSLARPVEVKDAAELLVSAPLAHHAYVLSAVLVILLSSFASLTPVALFFAH